MSEGTARQLAELRRLQSPGGRTELGAFSMEGTRLIERALAAEVPLTSVLCSESYAASHGHRERALWSKLEELGLAPQVATDIDLQELTAGRTFGSILAVAPLPEPTDLSALCHVESKAGAHADFRTGVLVVIDAADPGNVGALARTALASGARALVAVGTTDPFHPKAVRTSMGSLFRLPVCRFESAETWLDACANAFLLCGATAQGGLSLAEFQSTNEDKRPVALCVGSEAFGLDEALCTKLDRQLTIPMPPGVDSLSINAAAAVCLYELLGR